MKTIFLKIIAYFFNLQILGVRHFENPLDDEDDIPLAVRIRCKPNPKEIRRKSEGKVIILFKFRIFLIESFRSLVFSTFWNFSKFLSYVFFIIIGVYNCRFLSTCVKFYPFILKTKYIFFNWKLGKRF